MVKEVVNTVFGNGGTYARMFVSFAAAIILALMGWTVRQTNEIQIQMGSASTEIKLIQEDINDMTDFLKELDDVNSRLSRTESDIQELRLDVKQLLRERQINGGR